MNEKLKDHTAIVEKPAMPAEEPVARSSIQATAPAAPNQPVPPDATLAARRAPNPAPPPPETAKPMALLAAEEAGSFRTRWSDIQAGFVDEPGRAVQQADALVAELMQHLTKMFADERAKLGVLSTHREQRSTEDMRVALQRYRSFFNRLLSV